jgi:hypothetical protein
MMALMQLDYPGLSESYFVSSFIVGLKDGIKHYLIPHSPQTLCDTYWKAKELEKGILHKKSLMSMPSAYTRPSTYTNPTTHPKTTNPLQASSSAKPPPPNPTLPTPTLKQIPIKPREPGKSWGCNEPWTPEHKFSCKFKRAVDAMNLNPEECLTVEQSMEEENHVLLQVDTRETPADQQPQLLMLSATAARGL